MIFHELFIPKENILTNTLVPASPLPFAASSSNVTPLGGIINSAAHLVSEWQQITSKLVKFHKPAITPSEVKINNYLSIAFYQ